MKREQGIWLGGGLVVGFVAGFLVAYLMTADTMVGAWHPRHLRRQPQPESRRRPPTPMLMYAACWTISTGA